MKQNILYKRSCDARNNFSVTHDIQYLHSYFTRTYFSGSQSNDWTVNLVLHLSSEEYDVSFSMLDTVQGLKMHFIESFGLFCRHKKPSWIFKDWVTDWVPWSVLWVHCVGLSVTVDQSLSTRVSVRQAAAWAFTESRINPLGLSGRTWVSQFNVLRLGHLGERLLHPQGGQTRGRIVSPTLGHQFTHQPQTLDKHTQD